MRRQRCNQSWTEKGRHTCAVLATSLLASASLYSSSPKSTSCVGRDVKKVVKTAHRQKTCKAGRASLRGS